MREHRAGRALYIGGLGLLVWRPGAPCHSPLAQEVQDGLEGTLETDPTIVVQPTAMIWRVGPTGGGVVLDVITRVRSATIALRILLPV